MMGRRLLDAGRRAGGLQLGLMELLRSSATRASSTAVAAATTAACGLASAPLLSCELKRQMRQLLPLLVARPSSSTVGRPWQVAAVRAYAQQATRMPRSGYKLPVEMQRAMQMRLSMVSSNLLAEPYRGIPPKLPLTSYLTLSGWKEVWRRFLSHAKSMYALSRCKKYIPGFDRIAFKHEALDIYRDVCRLLAEGEKSSLRQLVTPAVFSDMKRQLKQREDGGWARVQWNIARELTVSELTTVHGRLIMINPKDDSTGFAQLTVRIPSQQRFAAYDKQGRLVAGNPEQTIDVEDFWVFEHAFKKSTANRWRLAGRLAILPHAVERKQQMGVAGHQQQQPQQQAAASQQQQQQQVAVEAEAPRVGHVSEQQRVPRHQWKEKRKAAAARGQR